MFNCISPKSLLRLGAALIAGLVVTSAAAQVEFSPADELGRYRYKVVFDQPGVLQQNPALLQDIREARRSGTSTRALESIESAQAARMAELSQALGRPAEATHHFILRETALVLRMTADEAARVAALPNVKAVSREPVYQLDTYRGPEFIGADQIWNGTATPDMVGREGRGMIAAVLDSGYNSDHPSFQNDPACGHGTGTIPNKVLSAADCSQTDMTGYCAGPSAEDTNSHGSHTASTVAGNRLDTSVTPPPTIPAPFTQISGVAPCASLRIYKVCPGSTCPGFDIAAGLDSVLIDGDASVMNYSISGGQNPWQDFDRTKLDLVAAGIFVAASAGNTSTGTPNPVGAVNHRGPWVMSVAASTRDGDFSGEGSISGPGTPPPATQNVPMDPGSDSPLGSPFTNKPIRRDPNQTAGAEGCSPPAGTPFPSGFFNGAVALIQRGSCTFTEKITNAFNAGADMVVIWNNTTGTISMSTPGQPNIPAYSIEQAPGQEMASFIDANPTTATFDFTLVPSQGDVLANFSLRGPTAAPLENLQKPNITGPGVGIYAAAADGTEYAFLSGTSMSSPHVAGAALLVRQAQPGWSVMELKSAMQMTSLKQGTKEDGVTPWDWDDVGSGRVDLNSAALAGLVMHETVDNFLAADPAMSGDVRTLNLPSVRDRNCLLGCSWTRRVTAGQEFETSWTVTGTGNQFDVSVTPTSFALAEREVVFRDQLESGLQPPASSSQEITITVSNLIPGAIRFGTVDFVEDGSLAPDAHITIAVED
ncbi:MAG: hypothetical protein Kow0020_00180 [Wenzhouxiangellaceae bacterium]